MDFAEIAFQNIAGFPQTGRLPLKSGLNALVSAETDLFQLLRCLFAPGTEDGKALATPAAPRKLAITIRADDGQVYRLVRDLDGGRTLLKSDPVTKKPVKVSDDDAEIQRAIMSIARIPPPTILEHHFWISQAALPSAISAAAKAGASGTDSPAIPPEEARKKLPELKAELERAEKFEQAQDALYDLQQRLSEYSHALGSLGDLEKQIADLTRKIDGFARFKEIGAGMEARIKKFPEAAARRDAALAEVRKKRADLEQALAAAPDASSLFKNQIFLGGLLAGVACVVAAALVGKPWLWLTNLVGFGVATFGALQWVGMVEHSETDRRRLADLNELEKKVQKQYELDVAPVQAAMQSLAVSTPEEVLLKLEERDLIDARRVALVRELEQKRADPQYAALEQERLKLEQEAKAREAYILGLGFTRDAGTIRREVELCESVLASVGGADSVEPLQGAIHAAARVVNAEPRSLLDALRERLTQYMLALTDRRYTSVRWVGDDQYHVVGTKGAVGPLSGLPPADADLVYLALRLALAERVAVHLKRPLFVDEPSVLIDAPHRPLFIKMLKSLAANTQIVVRAFEAPPAGVVDYVARAGSAA